MDVTGDNQLSKALPLSAKPSGFRSPPMALHTTSDIVTPLQWSLWIVYSVRESACWHGVGDYPDDEGSRAWILYGVTIGVMTWGGRVSLLGLGLCNAFRMLHGWIFYG